MTESANVDIAEREARRLDRPMATLAESFGRDVYRLMHSAPLADDDQDDIVRLYARIAFRFGRIALETP